jgi:hypothetical protein
MTRTVFGGGGVRNFSVKVFFMSFRQSFSCLPIAFVLSRFIHFKSVDILAAVKRTAIPHHATFLGWSLNGVDASPKKFYSFKAEFEVFSERNPLLSVVKVQFLAWLSLWFFVTCYGSIGWHKSTKSLSGERFN